jgi:ABC-type transporter lipoprotein component MlaA
MHTKADRQTDSNRERERKRKRYTQTLVRWKSENDIYIHLPIQMPWTVCAPAPVAESRSVCEAKKV